MELGAIRRMRNCYTPADVASFRDQVVRDLVPLTVKIKERQAKRLGIAWEDFTFTDNALSYKDAPPRPRAPRRKSWQRARRCTRSSPPRRGISST